MSAGSMSQSIALPREMLEFLGDYRTALKETKGELKELEKEAKRIEKEGGIVPDSLRSQIESARGQRNRLEDRLAQQKANKVGLRKAQQLKGQLRRYATDPIGVLSETAINRLERTAIGQRLQSAVTRGAAAIGNRLGQKTAIGLTGGAVLAGGALAAGLTKIGFDIAISRAKFRERGALGFAQTTEVFTDIAKGAAYGGTTAGNFQNVQRAALAEGTAARRAVENSGIYDKVKTFVIGGTSAGQDIEDKLAQSYARRAQRIQQYGAGYGQAVDIANIKRKRRAQYRAEMYKELGMVNTAANRIAEFFTGSQNTEFVDATSGYLNVLSLGLIETTGLKSAEIKVGERMKEMAGQKWEEDIKAEQATWNDTNSVKYALSRADAHETANAVNAFQNDLLSRGLTWSLQ